MNTALLFPPFRLDVSNEQLWRDTELLALRPKPFAVLKYLVEHAGQIVTQAELRKAVWEEVYVGDAVLRAYVRDLRQMLDDDAEQPQFIETISGRGYRFIAAVASSQHPVVSRAEEARDWRRETSPPSPQASSLPLVSRFVGRDAELAQLHSLFTKALYGERQLVFVTGEPGIGKTTLVDTFLFGVRSQKEFGVRSHETFGVQSIKSEVRDSKHRTPNTEPPSTVDPWIARGQCIEHYGTGEAYLPVLEALGQLCRQPGGEQVVTLLRQYAPTWLVQLPALVSDVEFEALQRRVQGTMQERMLREMVEAVDVLCAIQPLVLVLEDLHWSDVSTLDLLRTLARRHQPARLFIVGTYRPAEVIVHNPSLRMLTQELSVRQQCTELALTLLSAPVITDYLARRFAPSRLPGDLGQLLQQRTEGNPLFMVNVIGAWVEQGILAQIDGYWQVTTDFRSLERRIPETLRQLIEQQVEQLSSHEQELLEQASVIGEEFSVNLLIPHGAPSAGQIEERCEELVGRGQFLRATGVETLADGTVVGCYRFLHALYQQVLYDRLSLRRRTVLHRQIGEHVEHIYRHRLEDHASEIARHFEQAQEYQNAISYLTLAAEKAKRLFAPHSVVLHLSRALALLAQLPHTPERDQEELGLRISLGPGLIATKGYAAPEVEQVFTRALQLCQQKEQSPQLLPALSGLFRFYFVRANFTVARILGEQVLGMAQQTSDPFLFLVAHSLLGPPSLDIGDLRAAREHLEQGVALYDLSQHRFLALLYGDDPGVTCRCFLALTLWFSGHPDQARDTMQKAQALADELAIPYCQVFVQDFLLWVQIFCGERREVYTTAETFSSVVAEQGWQFFLGESLIFHGSVMVEHGQIEEGLSRMREGISTYQATGAEMSRPSQLGLLARACMTAGFAEEGLTAIAEALAIANTTGERTWEPELYRLKGELTLRKGGGDWGLGIGEEEKQKAKVKSQKSKITNPQPLTPDPHAEAEAEACFLKAIDIARQQQAKSWELRAVMSLVRLRQQQASGQGATSREQGAKSKERGTRSREHGVKSPQHATRESLTEAHEMLVTVYNWFTEGFDTTDLQEARMLLTALEK